MPQCVLTLCGVIGFDNESRTTPGLRLIKAAFY